MKRGLICAAFLVAFIVSGISGLTAERSGECPAVTGFGYCAVLCDNDFDCKRRQKCCSNGCGWECMDVKEIKSGTCTYNGLFYDRGMSFKDKCNVCWCRRFGKLVCTSKTCPNTMCSTGLRPKADSYCGGIAGLMCPKRLQCDMSNVPEGSADFPGICCRGRCPNGLTALTYTHCNAKRSCPKGYTCEYPHSRAKHGLCCIDCEAVKCTKPTCQDYFIPEGRCCPMCRKACTVNGVTYQSGESFYDQCNRCSCRNGLALCTKMACGPGCYVNGTRYGEREVIPSDNICELCKCVLEGEYKIRCKPIICQVPECKNPVKVKGECCPKCENDCSNVICPLIKCQAGYKSEIPLGECCPTCVQDCTVVLCLAVVCQSGEVSITPPARCCPICVPGDCMHNGQAYSVGDSFPDDCNTCTCMEDGSVACTEMFCGVCSHNRQAYSVGESYRPDSCNTCTCMEDGLFACTEMDCGPGVCEVNGVFYNAGDSFIDKCNTCWCAEDGSVPCTKVGCLNSCENGLSPLPETNCGGIAGLQCEAEGYECDFSNVPPFVSDGFGICCRAYTCQSGRSAYSGSHCDSSHVCPNGFNCEYADPTDSYGFCCLDCSMVRCANPECKEPLVSETNCCAVCPEPCTLNGETYASGESFFDECNQCTCNNGLAACTRKFCALGCYKDGIRYDEGEAVPSTDPCEECKCFLTKGKYEIYCAMQGCEMPLCKTPTYVKGKCCPVCLGCTDADGTFYNFGENVPRKDPCLSCTCTEDAGIMCASMACAFCENAVFVEGQCCPDCPEGCVDEDGILYNDGEVVPTNDPCEHCTCFLMKGRYEIACAMQDCARPPCENPTFIDGQCCPICTGCTDTDGTSYNFGDEVRRSDPCLSCTCTESDGIMCMSASCAFCANPVFVKGECCPVCPEGCIDKDGTVYNVGDDVPDRNPCEINCVCIEGGEIICAMVDCFTRCYDQIYEKDKCCPQCVCRSGGEVFQPGQVVPVADPCSHCTCSNEGRLECAMVRCALPSPCHNRMKPAGECCDICDDSVCEHEGHAIKAGDTLELGCCSCTCYYGETRCECVQCPPCPTGNPSGQTTTTIPDCCGCGR